VIGGNVIQICGWWYVYENVCPTACCLWQRINLNWRPSRDDVQNLHTFCCEVFG